MAGRKPIPKTQQELSIEQQVPYNGENPNLFSGDNRAKQTSFKGDTTKLSSAEYATYPRHKTKDDITYVKEIYYTPSFQQYFKDGGYYKSFYIQYTSPKQKKKKSLT